MTAIEFQNKLLLLQDHLGFFARSLTQDSEEARDLVQDTNVKALINRDKFQDNTNLKAWTYTIMKNTFINRYRRAVKANTIIDTTDDLYYLNTNKHSATSTPDSKINEKTIRKAINNLEEDQRKPFEMHTQGYKYKEIADELNLSIGTVKSRIFFTRKKLMNALHDFQN